MQQLKPPHLPQLGFALLEALFALLILALGVLGLLWMHQHALVQQRQQLMRSVATSVRNDYKLNTSKELSCKDLNLSNSTYQALAEGIEDFQLRYAQANPSAHTLQWKTANQVSDMTQVLAIEVCLRVASINTVHNTKPNANLKGCQDETLPADGRVRRTFKRVISLRNREGVLP